MAAVLRRVSALLSGEEHASLRRAFAELTLGMIERSATARAHPDLPSALQAAAATGGLNAMGSLLARRIDEHVETRVKAGIEAGIARELESAVAREEARLAREMESAVAREEARLARELESAVAREEARLARELESAVARETESAVARTRAETLEQGLERERVLLSRLAGRKFGAGAGAGLAALLAGVADPDRLAEIGDLVVDCADSAELLARAREETDRR